MFEEFIITLFALIHIVLATKAAMSSMQLDNQQRIKWIVLSLTLGFVGHYIFYSAQLDDN